MQKTEDLMTRAAEVEHFKPSNERKIRAYNPDTGDFEEIDQKEALDTCIVYENDLAALIYNVMPTTPEEKTRAVFNKARYDATNCEYDEVLPDP